jgi:CCR4-NOT transcription complex subunit 1
MSIIHPTSESNDDLPSPYLHKLLDRLIHSPPPSWNEESRNNLHFAVRSRFEKLGIPVPSDIANLLQLSESMAGSNQLIKVLLDAGPRGTSSLDECKEMLMNIETRDATFTHVANALLYMVFSQDDDDSTTQYDPSVFVAALRENRAGKRLDWQDVVGALDRPQMQITKTQFLALYNALLPLAQEYENFDIQLLWGGTWQNLETQLNFVVAFLSCTPDELDASAIPRLRSTYQLEHFDNASEEIRDYALEAIKYPYVSLDAVKALFTMIFQTPETYAHANFIGIPDAVINPHTELFTLAIAAVPGPWNPLQTQAFAQLFVPFLNKTLPKASFVMYGLWKRDQIWLIYRFIEFYQRNPLDLELIFKHAQDLGWVATLTTLNNEFGVDMAALAHRHADFNIQEWLENTLRAQTNQNGFAIGLARFLDNKAKNEINFQRKVPGTQEMLHLSLGTTAELLDFLENLVGEDAHLQLLKSCLTSYPRLINFGEGFDDLLNTSCEMGHQLSEEADQIMQEKYRNLYNNEIKVKDMIEDLQRFKQSDSPLEQDVFASLIKNLFDEFVCFPEYPLEALSHTAVLFGGVISYRLINRWALQLAMAMVLKAIAQSSTRDDKMYKFGVQALKKFQDRLPQWKGFCEQLLKIDLLKGTDIWNVVEEVVRSKPGAAEASDEVVDSSQAITNGDEDYNEASVPAFTCIMADPQPHDDFYETPPEDVRDKILFALNNVAPGNIAEKHLDIRHVLEEKHCHWLAEYLVDQRAKHQPNFQALYLSLLDLLGVDALWEEVIRETYLSIARLLNSEATLNNSTEKTQLRSLGSWLGSLTLARDIPILHRNLSFKDLLIQAHATQRLAIAIPFTCKTVVEATRGVLFKPPNPWTVDILRILLELHQDPSLRINLKFEIEDVCGKLKFEAKGYPPSTAIRESMAIAVVDDDYGDELAIAETMEPFPDMGILSSRPTGHRGSFSPSTLADSLPDVSQRLIYPPHSSNVVTNDQLRQIFSSAAQQAIQEIIFPVVERSVTIAAIAASQLVVKDFATEIDETKLRNAAHQMVKYLSGCLAMVTCREPLRSSMSKQVQAISRTYHDNIPEGVILMFVNDNLDTICRVIEEAAEKHSIAEIENHIREAISMRQVQASSNDDRPFNWPPSSSYAFIIPEPYKLTPGGLRPEQLAIYENFGTSGSGHLLASHDARQQMQDVFQEPYGAVSSLQAPTETATSRQIPQQRLVAPPVSTPVVQSQLNGYAEQPSAQDRLEAAFVELCRETRDSPEDRINAIDKNSPLRDAFARVIELLEMAGSQLDNVALFFANQVPAALFQGTPRRLEVEVLVNLLNELCRYSMNAARNILIWLSSLEDELLNPSITVALVSIRLMEIQKVDGVLAKALAASKDRAIACLAELVDHLLLSEQPLAIRSNLALSFEALVQWLQRDPDLDAAHDIVKKLQVSGVLANIEPSRSTLSDEIVHVFDEWVHLHRPDTADKLVAAFIRQLHHLGIMKTSEQMTMFLRTCFNLATIAYEQDPASIYKAMEQRYVYIDALATLTVSLVVYQGSHSEDGEVQMDRMHLFESILSILILYQCDHYQNRGEGANQKIFFRFYSTLLSEIHTTALPSDQRDDMYLAVGRALLAMQPSYLPGFVFGWLGLLSHRNFLGAMLTMSNDLVSLRSYGEVDFLTSLGTRSLF